MILFYILIIHFINNIFNMKIEIDFKELSENPLLTYKKEKNLDYQNKINNEINSEKKCVLSFRKFTNNTVIGIFLRLIGCNLRLDKLDDFYINLLKGISFKHEINISKNSINQQVYHKDKLSDNTIFTGIASANWCNYRNDFSEFVVKFFIGLKENKNKLLDNYFEIQSQNLTLSDTKIVKYLNEILLINSNDKFNDLFNFKVEEFKNNEDKKYISIKEDLLFHFFKKNDEINKKFKDLFNISENKFKETIVNFENHEVYCSNINGVILNYLSKLYVLNNQSKREEILLSNDNSSLKGIAPQSGNITPKDLFVPINKTQKKIKKGGVFYLSKKDGNLTIEINGEEKILKLIKKLIDLQDIKYIPVGHGMGEIKSVLL